MAGLNGCGTVFKITPRGTLTTLHSFDCTDGADALRRAGASHRRELLRDNLWRAGPRRRYGTVFKITPSGTLTTLHSFDRTTDGAGPYGGLVQATDGNFYGTTYGGAHTTYGHGLQNHPKRHADHAAQLRAALTAAYPSAGWCKPPTGTSTGQRDGGGAVRLWHGLQNHPRRAR